MRRKAKAFAWLGAVIVLAMCDSPQAVSEEVVCRWAPYETYDESFIFDLGSKQAYWVNENARYPVTEMNEGRIGFTGRRSSLRVSEADWLTDVAITFSINRITGQLDVTSPAFESRLSGLCAQADRLF
jgi:hypothetical protein